MKEENKEPNSFFCPLPWRHLSIEAKTLDFKVCCVSESSLFEGENTFNLLQKKTFEVMQSNPLKEIRKNMLCGQPSKACSACYKEEAAGAYSMRQFYLDAYPKSWNELSQQAPQDGSWDKPIKHLELRLGNLCNLRCVMCHPSSSSSFTDYNLIYDQTPASAEALSSPKILEEENLNFLIDQLKGVEDITFRGGEPLINPFHFKVLEVMKSTGQASAVSLSYTTNLTQLPDRLFDLWGAFKSVEVWVSVDGTDEVNHFIRYPSSWSRLNKNLEKLDVWALQNVDLNWGIVTTVQAYNAVYLDEIFDLLALFPTSYKTPFINHLQGPQILGFENLSRKFLEIATERLKKALFFKDCSHEEISVRDQKIRFIKRLAEKENIYKKRLENLLDLFQNRLCTAAENVNPDLEKLTKKISYIRKVDVPDKISNLFI
jgi:MoaA/NifB/PqqE/SkfB family radical SAM enzyme